MVVRSRETRDIMIIDFDKCLRVRNGDQALARKTTPYTCPQCATRRRGLTSITNSGKLRFDGFGIPVCDDHEEPVAMEPVNA